MNHTNHYIKPAINYDAQNLIYIYIVYTKYICVCHSHGRGHDPCRPPLAPPLIPKRIARGQTDSARVCYREDMEKNALRTRPHLEANTVRGCDWPTGSTWPDCDSQRSKIGIKSFRSQNVRCFRKRTKVKKNSGIVAHHARPRRAHTPTSRPRLLLHGGAFAS
jgi:hypothetical protein